MHVFRNTRDGRALCMAGTRTPQRLPELGAGGKWRHWRSFRAKLRASVAFGQDMDDLWGAIQEKGLSQDTSGLHSSEGALSGGDRIAQVTRAPRAHTGNTDRGAVWVAGFESGG